MNPAAALVAKRWAKPGSRKRQAENARKIAAAMTPEERSARAKKAAAARWNGRKASKNGTKVSNRDAKKAVSKRHKS